MNDDGSREVPSKVPDEPRRRRIARYVMAHAELDLLETKGQLIFNLGRKPGSGLAAVAVVFHPVAEDI